MGLFDELYAEHEPFRDVPCDAWRGRKIRILRLEGPDMIAAIEAAGAIEKDEAGNALDDAQAFEFGVLLLALCIADLNGNRVFDTEHKKKFLSSQVLAVGELTPIAIEVNDLGPDEDDEQGKKKSDKKSG